MQTSKLDGLRLQFAVILDVHAQQLDHVVLGLKCVVLQVWLVGDGLTAEEQERAQPGVHFVPYSQFPASNTRGDCVYHSTPALVVPDSYENLHACEVTKTIVHTMPVAPLFIH